MPSLAGEDHVSKRLWSFIRSQRKGDCSVPPIKFEGNIYSEHFDKAEALNNYFCSVFTTESHDNHPSLEDGGIPTEWKKANVVLIFFKKRQSQFAK